MIKLSSLKPSNLVYLNRDGERLVATVTDTYNDGAKEVCLLVGEVEAWYSPEDLTPIALDEEQLLRLGFEREVVPEGVKYKKGPFRVLLREPGNFSKFEMWYREDRRLINMPMYVHEFQNHYIQMTKIELNPA
ncbi:hypothetical protein [Gynurincola endophyticus]|uniref:hypothetical protein n=1 Tax=Gynurincola endophyticus TaxID=2479004 RepID=UPI001F280414|nr:hypothetical protein [Gynurincola endophyticus]